MDEVTNVFLPLNSPSSDEAICFGIQSATDAKLYTTNDARLDQFVAAKYVQQRS